MIYMEPGLSPGYRHEEEEEGKEGLEEAGGRRRGSQPWLRRFLASSLVVTVSTEHWCRGPSETTEQQQLRSELKDLLQN